MILGWSPLRTAFCTSLFLAHQRCRETSLAQCAVHRSIIFTSWMSSSFLLAIHIDLEFWVGIIILNLKFDLKLTKSTSFFILWNVGAVNISSQRVDPTEAFQSIMNCRKSNIPVLFDNRISMRFGIFFTLMANFRSFERGQPFLIDITFMICKRTEKERIERADLMDVWLQPTSRNVIQADPVHF